VESRDIFHERRLHDVYPTRKKFGPQTGDSSPAVAHGSHRPWRYQPARSHPVPQDRQSHRPDDGRAHFSERQAAQGTRHRGSFEEGLLRHWLPGTRQSANSSSPKYRGASVRGLQRNRRAVDRDLGLLEGAGLLKVSYQSNPGHGRLKSVSPVARQYTLTATV
jgi:hypothetical protein